MQTAWGRTGGKWFGIEHYGVTPDIITSAKGLGNGLPIGLTVARPEVAAGLQGLTISTFGGNPVTTTAAKAVIDFIDEHQLLINAAEAGAHLRGKLEELKAKHPLIGDVRGMGLMQAHRTGGGSRNQGARHRRHRRADGSRARKSPADRQGRPPRQCDPHHAAAEHFEIRCGRFRGASVGQPEPSRPACSPINMEEKAFYKESKTTKPATLNCPFCRTADTYELSWLVRKKIDRLPGGADERDRAKFAKWMSYMVLLDDKAMCKNMRCRKRFDVSGIKTTAFI